MKKLLASALMCCAFMLGGCTSDNPSHYQTTVTVKEVRSDGVLAEDNSTKETYSIPSSDLAGIEEIHVDDTLLVEHDGNITETWPAQFSKIYEITLK